MEKVEEALWAIEITHATMLQRTSYRGSFDGLWIKTAGIVFHDRVEPRKLYRTYTNKDDMVKDAMFLEKKCFHLGQKSFVYAWIRIMNYLEYYETRFKHIVWC